MKTRYDKQAESFLNKTGTEFKVSYLRSGEYFPGDEEQRDVYNITLTRGARSYSFEFGQSLNDSGFKVLPGGVSRLAKVYFPSPTEREKMLTNPHARKRALEQNVKFNLVNSDTVLLPVAPSPYDVLAALTKYDPGTFEDFCNEYGYSEDSKQAEKVYNAVVNEWQNIAMLYSDSEIEELTEIQ